MKAKRLAASGPVEGPWTLPDGWRWERLGNLVERCPEKVLPTAAGDLPFVGMESIPSGEMRVTQTVPFASLRSAGNRFRPADVLYGRLRPYLNKVWRADRHGACSGELLVLRSGPELDSDYLAYALHDFRFVHFASHAVTGDRPRLDFAVMADYPLPVPPLEQQRQAVACVGELFAEIDDGEEALARAREDLATWRKALLKAAVTGELTADWRAADASTETGADFLAQLASERHTAVRASGHKLTRTERQTSEPPFTVPGGWTWTTLGHLVTAGPTNGYSPKRSMDGEGTDALKLTATTAGRLKLGPNCIKTVSEKIPSGSHLYLQPGDLLFQRGNTREYVGMAAIFDGPPSRYIYPDLMIRVRLPNESLTKWVWRWSVSPHGRQYLMASAQGGAGTMPKISGQTLREMPVPLPPALELEAILSELSRLEAEAEPGDDDLVAMGRLPSDLRQSILSAAFRGELTG